jgi:hypothetical protein
MKDLLETQGFIDWAHLISIRKEEEEEEESDGDDE